VSRYSDDTLVMALVRQAAAVLDELGLPRSFTVDELHRRVEQRRGRRIHLIAHPMPPNGPHGMWVAGETDDYIFFDGAAPTLRKLQIIGHEFGHIIFDDTPAPVEGVQTRTLSACTRTLYDDMVEQRCEWFGTVVVQRTIPDPAGLPRR
jgi:hypothetical protein